MGKVKIGNFKGPQGETGPQGPAGPQGPEGPQGPMGEVDANTQIVFTQAESRENIASGEKLNIILGKIRKWFADIKAAAFQDVSNALTTTAAGYVLDARQGKILDGKIAGKLAKTDVVNGLTETAAGKALDARQGKVLDKKIDDLSREVSDLNSKSIVESGSNDNGHYRKYADGTLEMWGRTSANIWITNNQGSIYHSNPITVTLPIESKTTPVTNSNIESSGVIWTSGVSSSGDRTKFSFRAVAPASVSDLRVVYAWVATGTWK